MWAGLGVSVWALTYFAGHGFAYGGGFPVWPAAGLALGVVTLCAAFPRRDDGDGGTDGSDADGNDGGAEDQEAGRARRSGRARRGRGVPDEAVRLERSSAEREARR